MHTRNFQKAQANVTILRFLCSSVFQRFLFRTLVFAGHIAVIVVVMF